MQRLAEDDRVPGLKGPSSKAECEVSVVVEYKFLARFPHILESFFFLVYAIKSFE